MPEIPFKVIKFDRFAENKNIVYINSIHFAEVNILIQENRKAI
jgi:hypothetical protein